VKHDLATWRRLTDPDCGSLLATLSAAPDPAYPSLIARLRKAWPAHLVTAGVDLVIARRKGAAKFSFPDLLVDPVGMEQATSADVADHKARRFSAAGVETVIDLCCGIGGDAMSLARTGRVMVVDTDPARVFMARHNVERATGRRVAGLAADVASLCLPDIPFHIDPERRDETGRRRHGFDMARPDGAFLRALITYGRDGAVKTGPGADFDVFPPGEIEVINRQGTLVQAVLWVGRLSQGDGLRTATRLPDGISFTDRADYVIPCAETNRYLLAVDPAIERAGLMGALCRRIRLPAVHPTLGLLTASTIPDSRWVTPYEVLASFPWREKKAEDWFRAHDTGEVVVKTRDRVCDPDTLSRRLSGDGSLRHVLFVLRMNRRVWGWITRKSATG